MLATNWTSMLPPPSAIASARSLVIPGDDSQQECAYTLPIGVRHNGARSGNRCGLARETGRSLRETAGAAPRTVRGGRGSDSRAERLAVRLEVAACSVDQFWSQAMVLECGVAVKAEVSARLRAVISRSSW